MATKLILSALLVVIVSYFYFNDGPTNQKIPIKLGKIVETLSGSIQGSVGESRDGREFYQFFRIPYAQPPVGQLRFATPKPIGKWKGILDGTTIGPSCPQLGPGGFEGAEDCLHVNVYVPKLKDIDKKPLLPVLVWIHGGAFIVGGGVAYGPNYFMDENVVLITINYRLNLLGFMSTGDKEIRGNMGLKDQAAALKFIKDNVKNFHGNPEKITIFGESAGGASVHYLTLSQKTKGLFQKAISMSGAAVTPWAFRSPKTGYENTKYFAEKVNCPTGTSKELTQCLRNLDVKKLVSAYKQDSDDLFIFDPTKQGDFTPPVVEAIDDEEAFLVESPYDILVQGRGQRIPFLTGIVADEGLFSSLSFEKDRGNMKKMEDNWNRNLGFCLNLAEFPKEKKEEICSKIRNFYFPKTKSQTEDEKFEQYTRLFSEAYFSTYTSLAASIQRQFSPVYLYHLNKTGGPTFATHLVASDTKYTALGQASISIVNFVFNLFGLTQPTKTYGMVHADDCTLLFPYMNYFIVPKDEKNDIYQFSKSFVNLITQFAIDDTSMKFRNVKFPPLPKEGKLQYFRLDENPRLTQEPFEDAINFWKSLKILQTHSDIVTKSLEFKSSN